MRTKTFYFMGIILSVSLLFSGCKKDETKASDTAISVGTQVVEVADDYLDNKISNDDAKDKIDALYEELDYVENLTESDENYPDDLWIAIDVLDVSTAILLEDTDNTDATHDDVLEARNGLAEDVGMSSR